MRRRSEELLKRLHSTVDPEEMVSALSVAEKQMVEIAKAFLEDSRILIMDEPTTVLNRDETEILFGIMREFTERGGSVIYISHKLDEVREICDEVVVLRDGVLVADRDAKKVSSRELAELMVGRELSQVFPPKQKVPEDAPETLRVENLSSGKAVRNVSFVLHGEKFSEWQVWPVPVEQKSLKPSAHCGGGPAGKSLFMEKNSTFTVRQMP